MRKRALITGITGQDGSYLTDLLLRKDYEVHGLIRRASTFNTRRIDHVYEDPHDRGTRLSLHYGDLTDASALAKTLRRIRPDEIYNLGAQSHVRTSFDLPLYTADVVTLGTLRLLEAARDLEEEQGRRVRFYQASSSEMFGQARPPQTELTPLQPRSPYGCAKAAAHMMTVNYREAYGLHASCGILFNHESPRRGETFVTRKITRAVGRIKVGLQRKLYLGNLDARRDWGYAGDFVEAMWRMLQREEPGDYVVATGETHSVREFCHLAFTKVGLDWREFVAFDPRYLRPAEIDVLLGDATRARKQLGWRPRVGFRELVAMMVDTDLEIARREKALQGAGHVSPVRDGHLLDPVGNFGLVVRP